MSKFRCPCNAVIRTRSGDWNDYEFILIPKSKIAEMSQRLRGDPSISEDDFSDFMCEREIEVILCTNCNRIHVQSGYLMNALNAYVQEDPLETNCHCVSEMNNAAEKYDFDVVLLAKIEEVLSRIDREGMLSEKDFCELVGTQKMEIYKCPKCERLWVRKATGKFIPYKREFS
jgi:Zn-finger nucleic acid-binding protein